MKNGVDFGKYKRSAGIEVSLCSLPSGQIQMWMLYSERFNLGNPVFETFCLHRAQRPTPEISAAKLAQIFLRWPFSAIKRRKMGKNTEVWVRSIRPASDVIFVM